MTVGHLYSYPQSNDTIIKSLGLAPHPEGGHFSVTYVSSESVASPYASDKPRTVQSTIHYLLSMNQDVKDNDKKGIDRIQNHSSSIGVMHKNKSTVSGGEHTFLH
jgi:predicted cupin superfamily sugar epimerase